nr:hypothetical protein [Aquitalea magnusonii]
MNLKHCLQFWLAALAELLLTEHQQESLGFCMARRCCSVTSRCNSLASALVTMMVPKETGYLIQAKALSFGLNQLGSLFLQITWAERFHPFVRAVAGNPKPSANRGNSVAPL